MVPKQTNGLHNNSGPNLYCKDDYASVPNCQIVSIRFAAV